MDYFCDEYFAGRTPNPCVKCNQKLKFDVFEKKNEDLQLLLHQLQDNAELKMQLINRIKAEL